MKTRGEMEEREVGNILLCALLAVTFWHIIS